MKKSFLFLCGLLIILSLSSRAYGFRKGHNVVNANVGMKVYTPNLSLSFEHGVANFNRSVSMGLGLMVSTPAFYWTFLGARSAIHYTASSSVDMYGGAVLGYSLPYAFSADFFVGLRYMFNPHIGINLELAPTVSQWFALPLASAGISFRF